MSVSFDELLTAEEMAAFWRLIIRERDARRNEGESANARLIAAAPELLNACRVIALDDDVASYLFDNDPKALEQIRAAIAKATKKDR